MSSEQEALWLFYSVTVNLVGSFQLLKVIALKLLPFILTPQVDRKGTEFQNFDSIFYLINAKNWMFVLKKDYYYFFNMLLGVIFWIN